MECAHEVHRGGAAQQVHLPLAIEEQASASSGTLADPVAKHLRTWTGGWTIHVGQSWGLPGGRQGQDGKMRGVAERALIRGATRPTYAIRRDREGLAGFSCRGPKFLEPWV